MASGRSDYVASLGELETRALGAMDLVVKALDRAVEAVRAADVALAGQVVAEDDAIDMRYLEVHNGVLTLLATQAPVAGDLRLVAALLHTIRSIERMGDQCVNIAKLVPVAAGDPRDERLLDRVTEMGGLVRREVEQAKRAFADRDLDLAQALVQEDDAVDALNRECFRLAIETGDDPARREWAMTMMLASRALERTADYAVDIGEQVGFLVTGLFREFEDASRPIRRLASA
jgi:phosphate transport system protein